MKEGSAKHTASQEKTQAGTPRADRLQLKPWETTDDPYDSLWLLWYLLLLIISSDVASFLWFGVSLSCRDYLGILQQPSCSSTFFAPSGNYHLLASNITADGRSVSHGCWKGYRIWLAPWTSDGYALNFEILTILYITVIVWWHGWPASGTDCPRAGRSTGAYDESWLLST